MDAFGLFAFVQFFLKQEGNNMESLQSSEMCNASCPRFAIVYLTRSKHPILRGARVSMWMRRLESLCDLTWSITVNICLLRA